MGMKFVQSKFSKPFRVIVLAALASVCAQATVIFDGDGLSPVSSSGPSTVFQTKAITLDDAVFAKVFNPGAVADFGISLWRSTMASAADFAEGSFLEAILGPLVRIAGPNLNSPPVETPGVPPPGVK
jgi:hypothetical protein